MYWIAPIGGLVLCLLVIAILFVDLFSRDGAWLFLGVFVGWIAAGAAWAWVRSRYLAARRQARPRAAGRRQQQAGAVRLHVARIDEVRADEGSVTGRATTCRIGSRCG